jgi:hypothetical protein
MSKHSKNTFSVPLNDEQQQFSMPVLRWLGASPSDSPRTSPSTPTLRVLDEALHNEINRDLPAESNTCGAQPSESFRRTHVLAHPPAYFSNLTRSTLPTSSVSALFQTSSSNVSDETQEYLATAPVLAGPRESSIVTLRSLQIRSETHPPPPEGPVSPSPSPSQGWWPFSSTSKDEVDPLLSRQDRRGSAKDEAEHLQAKCTLGHSLIWQYNYSTTP